MARNFVGILIALASLVIGLPNTYAQNVMTVTVPFAFTIGQNDMPAGTYTVSSISDSVIAIRERDTGKGVLTLFRREWAGSSDNTPKLIFHGYSHKYFLSQVSRGFGSAVMQLPTSKLERELRIASTRGAPELRTIAATK